MFLKLSTQSDFHADFRPISITPILSRIMERLVVRSFFPLSSLTHRTFPDQLAFRPTVYTTAALIWILYTITQLLSQHDYVIVLALDFSKAFNSVRHSTLFDKLARLYIPDHVYNWLH